MAAMGDSPEGLAHHLGWLQLDLGDPEFHRFAQRNARDTRSELRRLVADAIEAGELPRATDDAEAARLIETTVSGSLMTWGFHREGTAKAWVSEDLERVLRLLTEAAGS